MRVQDLYEAEERSILSVMGKQDDPYTHIFNCSYKSLTSLQGAPSTVNGSFSCSNNKLTSLNGIQKLIKRIDGSANFEYNPIKSHVLGLLMIDGLTEVYLDNKEVRNILNKYIWADRDVFACQEELIEAGFPDFAKL